MIDYEDYKRYLEKIGFSGNSLNTYPSYISQNKLDIFATIDSYADLSNDEKLIKFSNEDSSFQEIFDRKHTFESHSTFFDLRSGARRYKHYLQYKAIKKSMDEYDKNPSSFDLNGASIYFSVFDDKKYPVKAICRKNIDILELQEDFRTNGGKHILKQIFNMKKKENIRFVNINNENPSSVTSSKIEPSAEISPKSDSLNQILYGPPGTGKTYNTINRALEIIDGEVPQDRSEAKARFKKLSKAGQIEFVTFHQSYGYEEFVEGIKASSDDGEISYDVEDGIFKKLSHRALQKNELLIDVDSLDFNDYLLVGQKFKTKHGKEFQITKIDEDIYFEQGAGEHKALRKTILELLEDEKIMLNEIYYSSQVYIAREIYKKLEKKTSVVKNYILIIDEINRGNISKIFGELITLIEPSKRIGASEEVRLRLPYSNDEFGVPSNLYIIGTMNTADRSIALMDTALRRRFEFVEMMPDYEVLKEKVGVVSGVDISLFLQKINARVEYLYDRDHTIGHAYFIELNKNSSLDDLNAIMRNKIIPLLQEYFYDDWEKIKLVLNDGFINAKRVDATTIFESIDDEYIEEDKFVYSILDLFEEEAYLRLCQTR